RADGVTPGDVFEVFRPAPGVPGTAYEEVRMVLEILHTRDHSAAGLVLNINHPDLRPGMPVRLVRKMPSCPAAGSWPGPALCARGSRTASPGARAVRPGHGACPCPVRGTSARTARLDAGRPPLGRYGARGRRRAGHTGGRRAGAVDSCALPGAAADRERARVPRLCRRAVHRAARPGSRGARVVDRPGTSCGAL